MKKAILVLLCCAMLASTASCNNNDCHVNSTDTSSKNDDTQVSLEQPRLTPEPYSDLTKMATIWRDEKAMAE